ncbi:phosphoribosylanthranilate isomerase [Paremcibacter congregatus]|uniref:phosphoribosylanthranilate isomerase n=1 Tax=Paremcibacter congregatus TaxID=2043170 RepID=UPI0030ED7F3D|tara:strand:- start:49 stop:726 length:678 start_codon:yes stop_codon:yes gene_type:complete
MTSVQAKICGITTRDSLEVAVRDGARYIGFVFFDRSPRNISLAEARALAAHVPDHVTLCGVFVNPADADLAATLDQVPLGLIQLHGSESPERVREVKDRFQLPVMKAFAVRGKDDITRADQYATIADMLLFDAKAPENMTDALPGGNGLSFDWRLIKDHGWSVPWMLSGGLTPENVNDALRQSGAHMVDVSSGVEDHPGVKSLDKISTFLKAVQSHKAKATRNCS